MRDREYTISFAVIKEIFNMTEGKWRTVFHTIARTTQENPGIGEVLYSTASAIHSRMAKSGILYMREADFEHENQRFSLSPAGLRLAKRGDEGIEQVMDQLNAMQMNGA